MSSENERDASASTRKGKKKILMLVLVLMLASRPFSRWNKQCYACACVCVASENQAYLTRNVLGGAADSRNNWSDKIIRFENFIFEVNGWGSWSSENLVWTSGWHLIGSCFACVNGVMDARGTFGESNWVAQGVAERNSSFLSRLSNCPAYITRYTHS